MIIVLLYFTSFLFIAYLSMSIADKRNRAFFQLVMCFILLFGFFGFRDLPILNDTAHYYGHLYKLTKFSTFFDQPIFHFDPHERFEYGYMVFVRFLGKYISSNPYIIIIVSSLLITIANIKLISKNTNQIALAIFFFMLPLLGQFSTIRQSFAIMLFYIAFYYLQEKHLITYCVLILLAYGFHRSAVILFVFPIFSLLQITRRNVFLVISIGLVVAVMIYPLLHFMNYSDSFYFLSNLKREVAPFAAIVDVIYTMLMLACCYYMHWKFSIPLPHRLMVWAAILSISCRIIGVPFLAFNRFNAYFYPFSILLFMYFIDYQLSASPSFQMPHAARQFSFGTCIHAMEKNEFTADADVNRLKNIYSRRFILCAIIAWYIKFIIILSYKNEWYHLVPYTWFDFRDGYHNYLFGY